MVNQETVGLAFDLRDHAGLTYYKFSTTLSIYKTQGPSVSPTLTPRNHLIRSPTRESSPKRELLESAAVLWTEENTGYQGRKRDWLLTTKAHSGSVKSCPTVSPFALAVQDRQMHSPAYRQSEEICNDSLPSSQFPTNNLEKNLLHQCGPDVHKAMHRHRKEGKQNPLTHLEKVQMKLQVDSPNPVQHPIVRPRLECPSFGLPLASQGNQDDPSPLKQRVPREGEVKFFTIEK